MVMNLFVKNNRPLPEQLFETRGTAPVSTYDSYEAAQHAIDVLGADGFQVKNLFIVGNGLRSFERVTAKLTYTRVALTGVVTGLYFGVGIALFSAVFAGATPELAGAGLLGSMIIGVALGMLLTVGGFALNKRRRTYTSVTQVMAERYDLLAPRGDVAAARRILQAHAEAEHR